MKKPILIIAVGALLLVGLWLFRVHQIDESKKLLVEKINSVMEGETAICARKVDDYSWKDYAIHGSGFGEITYGPTLVMYSLKKISDEEYLFKRVLVRSAKKLNSVSAALELNELEETAKKEMPQCENRINNLDFLRTLGRAEVAVLGNKYWVLTNVNKDEYGTGKFILNYKSSLGGISSGGKTEAMVSTDNVVYKLVARPTSYGTYIKDIFSDDMSL